MNPKFIMATDRTPGADVVTILSGAGEKSVPTTSRSEALAKYRAGELKHGIAFVADVYASGPNKNHTILKADELEEFAKSFVGQPFLKDHSPTQDARGGTIKASELVEIDGRKVIRQTIEVVKPWAIESYLDGTIDRFSIGWHANKYDCTVCKQDFFDPRETHGPWDLGNPDGKTGETVEVLMSGLEGEETSAVTHPAVRGTGIREQLAVLAAARSGYTLDGVTATTTGPAIEMFTVTGWDQGKEIEKKGKEKRMLNKILSTLGLAADVDEATALAELDKRLKTPPPANAVPVVVLRALELKEGATVDDAVLAIMGIKQPGNFVPAAQFMAVKAELNKAKASNLIAKYEAEGKITPAFRDWAIEKAAEDPAYFEKYMERAPVHVAPGAPVPQPAQVTETKPGTDKAGDLTTEDELVMRITGKSREEFLKAKNYTPSYLRAEVN